MAKVRKIFLFAFILLAPFSVFAQDRGVKIEGKVFDESTNEALIGVLVSVQSGKTKAVTDRDGAFQLEIEKELPVTLVINYLGYRQAEIEVYSTEEPVRVGLRDITNSLDEVVVIGYGTQKRSEISGSVASVPLANLSQASAVSSFDNLLGGTVAGVNVVQSSGQPGASSSIRIRGGNSINGGNEPLYVIDGFIMYNDNTNVETGVARSGAALNALSTINPTDIESIDVLKDASATAIYGSRGANGVILITTKKGKKGSDLVTYSASVGWSQVTRKLDLLNAKDWAKLRNDISAPPPILRPTILKPWTTEPTGNPQLYRPGLHKIIWFPLPAETIKPNMLFRVIITIRKVFCRIHNSNVTPSAQT